MSAVPDDLALPPDEAVALAQRYLDEGRPFAAHEVFESVWKAAPAADRDFWQGLAQVAVGLTHLQRGNRRGAVTLLRRGAERLDRAAPPTAAHGITQAHVVAFALDAAAQAGRGADQLTQPPHLRLAGPP